MHLKKMLIYDITDMNEVRTEECDSKYNDIHSQGKIIPCLSYRLHFEHN